MMKTITAFLLALGLCVTACESTPPASSTADCHCTFNGREYVIKQNSKGAVYGVPANPQ